MGARRENTMYEASENRESQKRIIWDYANVRRNYRTWECAVILTQYPLDGNHLFTYSRPSIKIYGYLALQTAGPGIRFCREKPSLDSTLRFPNEILKATIGSKTPLTTSG